MYSISREELAQMVAAHTCSIDDAIPEQPDFTIADAMIRLMNEMIDAN